MTAFDKDVLARFKRLLQQRLAVHKVILFGSRARGDADPDSDYDVLVVVEDELDDKIEDLISDCAWQAGIERALVIVPIAFSRQEWEQGPERNSLLARSVEAEGISI